MIIAITALVKDFSFNILLILFAAEKIINFRHFIQVRQILYDRKGLIPGPYSTFP